MYLRQRIGVLFTMGLLTVAISAYGFQARNLKELYPQPGEIFGLELDEAELTALEDEPMPLYAHPLGGWGGEPIGSALLYFKDVRYNSAIGGKITIKV